MLQMLSDFLPKEYPAYFKRQGNTLTALKTDESFQIEGGSMHPLEACARIVQACLSSPHISKKHQCNGHQHLAECNVSASAISHGSNLLMPSCNLIACTRVCSGFV